ncbi:hypothetical protein [Desulfosoma sp.]
MTFREYLRSLLEKAADFQVVDFTVDGEDAVQKALALKPDLSRLRLCDAADG